MRHSFKCCIFHHVPEPGLSTVFLIKSRSHNDFIDEPRMYQRDVTRMQTFKDVGEKDITAISAPSLIICGDNDVVRPEHAVEMYRKMQHAKLAILPGGHGDFIGELTTLKPGHDEFPALSIIETFLSDTTAK